MKIEKSTHADTDAILQMLDWATEYQKTVAEKHWVGFDRAIVTAAIDEGRQWKISENGEMACIFTVVFEDALIWKEKDSDPAIYLHRIATNPKFRGRGYVKAIVLWAKTFAQANQKAFVRMDTGSGNERLNNYYISCGFDFLGITELGDAPGLPAHYQNNSFSLFEFRVLSFEF